METSTEKVVGKCVLGTYHEQFLTFLSRNLCTLFRANVLTSLFIYLIRSRHTQPRTSSWDTWEIRECKERDISIYPLESELQCDLNSLLPHTESFLLELCLPSLESYKALFLYAHVTPWAVNGTQWFPVQQITPQQAALGVLARLFEAADSKYWQTLYTILNGYSPTLNLMECRFNLV